MKRVIYDIIFFLSLFALPFWISIILAILGIFLFNLYYEFIIGFLVWYSVFGLHRNLMIMGSPFLLPLVLILSFFVLSVIKRYIIIYKNDF